MMAVLVLQVIRDRLVLLDIKEQQVLPVMTEQLDQLV
jgi:hypothetical protein